MNNLTLEKNAKTDIQSLLLKIYEFWNAEMELFMNQKNEMMEILIH